MSLSTDNERVAFVLDENQPDDLKLPLVNQISDEGLVEILTTLKTTRRYASDPNHDELALAAAQAIQDGKLLEEAAMDFPEWTLHIVYPILVEKCPSYTPEFILRDKHAWGESRTRAREAIVAQAAKEHRCLYITSEKSGEKELFSNSGGCVPVVFADTDPYISLTNYMSAEDPRAVVLDEEDGHLVLWELRPGGFRELYAGRSCSLYSVPEAFFINEPIVWETNRASTMVVPVVCEKRIEDTYQTLVAAARDGLCVMHEYAEDKEYMDAVDLALERTISLDNQPALIVEDGTLVSYIKPGEYEEEVVVPDGVTRIGCRAFYEAWVGSVIIPEGVTCIEAEAFYGCTLSHVTIPSSVTTIEEWAFAGCENLHEVVIPGSVTSIERWAFGYRRNWLYYDPAPVDRNVPSYIITLIGEPGSEAQRYADDNTWYDCCLIATFKEA